MVRTVTLEMPYNCIPALHKLGLNNRMGKARDVFKKIRNTKGTFHAKMGTIKERNGMI